MSSEKLKSLGYASCDTLQRHHSCITAICIDNGKNFIFTKTKFLIHEKFCKIRTIWFITSFQYMINIQNYTAPWKIKKCNGSLHKQIEASIITKLSHLSHLYAFSPSITSDFVNSVRASPKDFAF